MELQLQAEAKTVEVRFYYMYGGTSTVLRAYEVPRTEGVLVTYKDGKFWRILHVPTSGFFASKFASREEAEDVACWIWLNVVDWPLFSSTVPNTVAEAAGWRVRCRMAHKNCFLEKHSRGRPKIRCAGMWGRGEEIYTQKTLELEAKLAEVANREKAVEERENQFALREQTFTDQEKRIQRSMEALETRTKQLEERESDQNARAVRLNDDLYELNTASTALEQLRTKLVGAIVTLEPNAAVRNNNGIERELRGIKIRGKTLDT